MLTKMRFICLLKTKILKSWKKRFSPSCVFLQASIFKRKLIANFGQSIHLSCSVGRSVSTQVRYLDFLSLL